ncbi:MAG: SRPBCC family protein [Hyphomicrobiales bacterium]
MRIGFQVAIEAPAERIWRYVGMPENWLAWSPELHLMDCPGGFDPEKPVGAKVRQILRGRGGALQRQGEITAYEPCRLFAMRLSGRGLVHDIELQLGPIGTGTFVAYDEVSNLSGWSPKVMALLRQPVELRRLSHRMARLKQLSEDAASAASAR